jgi:phytoene synthase
MKRPPPGRSDGSNIKAVTGAGSTAKSAEITKQSKSNLALAFVSLGPERRRDMTTFYAFCRVIDDIADSEELSAEQKQIDLTKWRGWVRTPAADEPSLASELRGLLAKYRLPPDMLDEIITGVEMDLHKSTYHSFEELRTYCYHVASAVGLVSIEIFGYRNPRCKEYAVELGLALQVTNIIRDVGKDLEKDRIYLPLEDMERFDYSPAELRNKTYNEKFVRLLQFESERAKEFFRRAAAVLPREDRHSMVAAEIMGSVYRTLLRRMEKDSFRVFEKHYRLNKLEKAGRVIGQMWKLL